MLETSLCAEFKDFLTHESIAGQRLWHAIKHVRSHVLRLENRFTVRSVRDQLLKRSH